jgi:hypothetical protein
MSTKLPHFFDSETLWYIALFIAAMTWVFASSFN